MVAAWNETTLPTLLTNYSLENIYNADEFGLFFQHLRDKSYRLKSEKCSGGKYQKRRITGKSLGLSLVNLKPLGAQVCKVTTKQV